MEYKFCMTTEHIQMDLSMSTPLEESMAGWGSQICRD